MARNRKDQRPMIYPQLDSASKEKDLFFSGNRTVFDSKGFAIRIRKQISVGMHEVESSSTLRTDNRSRPLNSERMFFIMRLTP